MRFLEQLLVAKSIGDWNFYQSVLAKRPKVEEAAVCAHELRTGREMLDVAVERIHSVLLRKSVWDNALGFVVEEALACCLEVRVVARLQVFRRKSMARHLQSVFVRLLVDWVEYHSLFLVVHGLVEVLSLVARQGGVVLREHHLKISVERLRPLILLVSLH